MLPLLSLLRTEPLLVRATHFCFQELAAARALHRGTRLPRTLLSEQVHACEPWLWGAWWMNVLLRGPGLGAGFPAGLLRAAGLSAEQPLPFSEAELPMGDDDSSLDRETAELARSVLISALLPRPKAPAPASAEAVE